MAVLAFLADGTARAETRIVSVKSDAENLGIASVSSGGTILKAVGTSKTSLFVEAGTADAPFACKQALTVTLTDKRQLTRDYDLCALGYTVSVDTAAARVPEPPRPAPTAAGQEPKSPAGRIERKLVMIQTSDDTAIREVEIDGTPVQVRRRAQARVFIEIAGNPNNDGQIDCRRDMRLVLADGRILQDRVDICGDWKVTMDAAATLHQTPGATRTVRQAVPSGSGPSAPQRSGGVRPADVAGGRGETLRGSREDTPGGEAPATENGTGIPDAAPGLGNADPAALPLIAGKSWTAAPDGAEGWRLVYGVPETDDQALVAACRAGSDAITLTLPGLVGGLAEGQPLQVTLAARDLRKAYAARGSAPGGETGQSDPVLQLSVGDPLWDGLIRGEDLSVALDGTWRARLSLAGSAGPVRRFREACARVRPAVARDTGPASGRQVGGGGWGDAPRGGDPSCADEGFAASVPSDRPARLVIANDRDRPVAVYWLDFDGLRQFQASIPPGGRMVQRTLAGHPWLVAAPGGRCLAVFTATPGERVVRVAPGRPPALAAPVAPPPPADWSPPPADPGRDFISLSYDCDNGRVLDVTIDNTRRQAIVREQGNVPVTLPDTSRGVDFSYVGQGFALYGDGRTVTWEGRGARPTFCTLF